MKQRMRITAILVAIALTGWDRPAFANDIQALSNLLLPVDMAQNFVAICSLHNPGFLQDTAGAHGTMLWYAQHMKEEVIASLPPTEAHTVMVEAAGKAKAMALDIVHAMDRDGLVDQIRMNAWCAGSAKPFIEKTIVRHDTQHASFDRLIAKAKH
jgi:hypothetical protein